MRRTHHNLATGNGVGRMEAYQLILTRSVSDFPEQKVHLTIHGVGFNELVVS